MSKANNLKDFLVDLANAIREKKNKTGAINPQNFSAEILSIIAGDVQMPNVSGTLVITEGITEEDYEALKLVLGNNITIDAQGGIYIHFEDPEVLKVLLANITPNDGVGITTAQVEAVTSIGTWFKNNTVIETFDEFEKFSGVKSITDRAFSGCTSLKRVILPEGFTTFNSAYHFEGDSALEYVYLPQSITSLGNQGAFWNCPNLVFEDVNLPNLTSMGACFNGTQVKKVSNLGKITSISGFNKCKVLISVVLPETVKSIGDGCFSECIALKTINIPDACTYFNNNVFNGCIALMSPLVIPKGTTYIGSNAFKSTPNAPIENLDCPNLGTLRANAFYDSGIKKVSNLGTITTLEGDTFSNCANLIEVHLPNSLEVLGSRIFNNSPNVVCDISNLNNVTGITHEAFKGVTGITGEVNMPKLKNPNGYNWFYGTGITKVVSLGLLTIIPGSTFENCLSLTEATINEGITDIQNFCFRGCTALVTLNLPSTLTSLNNIVFNCTSLEHINAENVTSVVGFNGCKSLRPLPFMDKITSWNGPMPESLNWEVFHLPICTTLASQFGRLNSTGITTAILPAATTLGDNWMYNDYTTKVYIRDAATIQNSGWNTRQIKRVLVVENTTPASISNSGVFGYPGTPTIYVPDSALQTYASATNWSEIYNRGEIKGISQLATDYPEFYAILKGTAEGYEDMAKWGYLADW